MYQHHVFSQGTQWLRHELDQREVAWQDESEFTETMHREHTLFSVAGRDYVVSFVYGINQRGQIGGMSRGFPVDLEIENLSADTAEGFAMDVPHIIDIMDDLLDGWVDRLDEDDEED